MHSNSQAQPFPPMTREELEQIADDFGNVGIGGYGQWIVPARLAIADIFRVFATARLTFSERETPDQRQPSVTDGGHIELNEDDQVAFVRVLGHGEDLRDDPRISDLMVHLDEGPITAPQDVERFLDAAIAVTPPTEVSGESDDDAAFLEDFVQQVAHGGDGGLRFEEKQRFHAIATRLRIKPTG